MKGAQPTDTVNAILRFKGVLLKKHLQLGVAKGAITQEQADERLNAWIEDKEARIKSRQEATADKKREFQTSVDGKPKAKPKPPVVEAAAAPAAEDNAESLGAAEEVSTVAEETAEAIAASSIPTVEEAPAAEEVAAPAAEENTESAPAAEEPAAEEKPTTEENTSEA